MVYSFLFFFRPIIVSFGHCTAVMQGVLLETGASRLLLASRDNSESAMWGDIWGGFLWCSGGVFKYSLIKMGGGGNETSQVHLLQGRRCA